MAPYIYALGAVLCWASLPAAIGSGLQGLTTEELMFYSFTAAAGFLYLQGVLVNKSFRLYVPGVRQSLVGIWGIFGYHYVYYTAMTNTPLAESAILATTWSFWIVIFSSLISFRRLKPSIVITALLGMAGAGLVISSGKTLSFDAAYMKGYLPAVLCGLIWSSFSVALPHLKMKEDPMTAFTLYAALLSAGLFFLSGPHPLPGARTLASALYLGFVPLGLSFSLWNKAVTRGNLAVIGFLSYLTPPLAVLLVALVHGQHVPGQVIAGMGVIIAASLLGKFAVSRPGQAHHKKKSLSLPVLSLSVAVLFFAIVGVSVLTEKLPPFILAMYTGISLLTFIIYGKDKSAARKGAWRTRENTLHLLSLAGGWPGALVARQTLRHKSQKQSFRLVFWLTVLLNCGAFIWLLTQTDALHQLVHMVNSF